MSNDGQDDAFLSASPSPHLTPFADVIIGLCLEDDAEDDELIAMLLDDLEEPGDE